VVERAFKGSMGKRDFNGKIKRKVVERNPNPRQRRTVLSQSKDSWVSVVKPSLVPRLAPVPNKGGCPQGLVVRSGRLVIHWWKAEGNHRVEGEDRLSLRDRLTNEPKRGSTTGKNSGSFLNIKR